MSESVARSPTVAKVNKSLLVPEDLNERLSEFEGRTGVTFTRLAVASLLQYLYSNPEDEGPDPIWIQFAVRLDRGEITLDRLHDEFSVHALERAAPYLVGIVKFNEAAKKAKTTKDFQDAVEKHLTPGLAEHSKRTLRIVDDAIRRLKPLVGKNQK